jgi:hypothetical protein
MAIAEKGKGGKCLKYCKQKLPGFAPEKTLTFAKSGI